MEYLEPGVTCLDILKAAEQKGLDIIAFTEHNTVAGYRAMPEEIRQLELLEQLGRLRKEEDRRLKEYHRLRKRCLCCPGSSSPLRSAFTSSASFPPI